MRKIKFFDTTLRDGEQSPGCSMNTLEKVRLAGQLEKLGVDIIKDGFAISSPDEIQAIKKISKSASRVQVCSLARAVEIDLKAAAESLKFAQKPRIHTFLAMIVYTMKIWKRYPATGVIIPTNTAILKMTARMKIITDA